MNNRYILFQAYGRQEILAECRLAILQLLQYNDPKDVCLVLYTDNPAYFKKELKAFDQSIIESLTPELIKEWRGSIDFVFRVKIMMLQHFFNTHTGSVLYLDCDTCCQKPITTVFEAVENGTIFMHTNEGLINQPENFTIKKWQRFFKNNSIKANGKTISDVDGIAMWNAGVIGMHSSKACLLKDVLAITEAIHPVFPNHTVEQFAFSYVFQKHGVVSAADAFIFHYWNLKEYRIFLQRFFDANKEDSPEELAKKIAAFLPEPIMNDKMQYKKLPFFKKMFAKKWDFDVYMQLHKNINV